MIFKLTQDICIVNWKDVKYFEIPTGDLTERAREELTDYRRKINEKLRERGILATYDGADTIDSNKSEGRSDGYHYVAVKGMELAQAARLGQADDLLRFLNKSTPPQDEREATERLLRLANLQEVGESDIQWDWNQYPTTRKWITKIPLTFLEKFKWNSQFNKLDFDRYPASSPVSRRPNTVPSNQMILNLAESVFDDSEILFFLVNLTRWNLITSTPQFNVESFTAQQPRIHALALEFKQFLEATTEQMKQESGSLWKRETNLRIFEKLSESPEDIVRTGARVFLRALN